MKRKLSYAGPRTPPAQGHHPSPQASVAPANHAATLPLISALHSKKG